MEQYLFKINQLIKTNGIPKYKINLKSKKQNLKLHEINNLLKKYHKNTKLFYFNEKDSNPIDLRPMPKFKFDNDKNIGFIKFYHFICTNDIYSQKDAERLKLMVSNKLNLWLEKSFNRLIIDLSECYGNLFNPIIESLSIILGNLSLFAFVKNKSNFNSPVWINIKNRKILEYPEVFRGSKIKFKGKISVLVSNKTSSSAEIVASIFQGKENVKVIGQETNGKLFYTETFLMDSSDKLYLSLPSKLIQNSDLRVLCDEKIIPDIKTKNYLDSLKHAYNFLL